MDIETANDIYWMKVNCYESDCWDESCNDCDYFVTEEEYKEALAVLKAAGLVNEEGDLI